MSTTWRIGFAVTAWLALLGCSRPEVRPPPPTPNAAAGSASSPQVKDAQSSSAPPSAVSLPQAAPAPRSVPIERAAATARPIPAGPPWPGEICVTHAMGWSAALEAKYVQKGAGRLSSMVSNKAFCSWYYSFGPIKVGVVAGADETQQFLSLKKNAKLQFGLPLVSYEQTNGNLYRLTAWSEEPPYMLSVIIEKPTPDSRSKSVELVKDMVAHLTRERLSQRTAQIVTLYRDKRGERARKFLEAWPSLKGAFDHLAPLAPGFPRLARGSEFQGDPGKSPATDDTFVLLGVCPPPEGEQLHSLTSFLVPFMETKTSELFVVDAEDLSIECPTFTEFELIKPGDYNKLPSGLVFSQGFSLSGAPDPIGLRGAAILRDQDFNILDVALYEIRRPPPLENVQGRYQSIARRAVLPKCDAYAETQETRYFCRTRWSDLLCHGQLEASGGQVSFEVTPDQRIRMRQSDVDYPGTDCHAPE